MLHCVDCAGIAVDIIVVTLSKIPINNRMKGLALHASPSITMQLRTSTAHLYKWYEFILFIYYKESYNRLSLPSIANSIDSLSVIRMVHGIRFEILFYDLNITFIPESWILRSGNTRQHHWKSCSLILYFQVNNVCRCV